VAVCAVVSESSFSASSVILVVRREYWSVDVCCEKRPLAALILIDLTCGWPTVLAWFEVGGHLSIKFCVSEQDIRSWVTSSEPASSSSSSSACSFNRFSSLFLITS